MREGEGRERERGEEECYDCIRLWLNGKTVVCTSKMLGGEGVCGVCVPEWRVRVMGGRTVRNLGTGGQRSVNQSSGPATQSMPEPQCIPDHTCGLGMRCVACMRSQLQSLFQIEHTN